MRNKLAVVLNYVEDGDALYPLTSNRPIASLPFNGRYRLMDFILSSMYHAESISAAVFIGTSGHSIYDHVRSGDAWGLDSSIGGGVFTHSRIDLQRETMDREDNRFSYYNDHRSYIEKTSAQQVLVAGSHILAHVDLSKFLDDHQTTGCVATVGYRIFENWTPAKDSTFNTLTFDGDNVREIKPIKEAGNHVPISLQMGIVEKNFLLECIDIAEERDELITADAIVNYALERDLLVQGYAINGYVKVIETINDYYKANMDMIKDETFKALMVGEHKVITRTHHGAPTYYGPECSVSKSNIATSSEIYGEVDHSIIFRKVVVAPTATVKNSVLMNRVTIGEGAELEYCILDMNVTVADGVKIKGTPDSLVVIEKHEVINEDIIN